MGSECSSSACLALRSVSAVYLLGHYKHYLWDLPSEILQAVPEDYRASLAQTIQDGQDAANMGFMLALILLIICGGQ